MATITLKQREKGPNSREVTLFDEALQTGGITIDNDAYGPTTDRVYNVKGLKNLCATIRNSGANGLIYSIQKARKEYQGDPSTQLVDADYTDVVADTTVAASGEDSQAIIDISPESTAIRIRVREETATQDTTLEGNVSFN